MAKRVAQFHKVSFEQFKEDFRDTFGAVEDKEIQEVYDAVRLPKRATAGSAGYDFFTPVPVVLHPGSGLGFKYRLQLNNTVGIIDSDYFYSDNEGHIFAKITNDTNEEKTVELEAGAGFMQGIFVEYGITMDDDVTEIRNGGFGSTSN